MITIFDKQGVKILSVEVDDRSYRNRAIMGDNNLTLNYSLAEHVEVPVGAYCVFENERYTLMRPENLKMKHSREFEYTLIMEGDEAKAKIWKFRNPVDGRLKFSLTAKPREHLQMFVDNMNRRDTGWTVGECLEKEEICINYDHVFCYDALSQMASEFKTEFFIQGKNVSLKKVEFDKNSPLPLSYGRGNGFLPNIGRSNFGDSVPVEILFVQGGKNNIDKSKYGNSVLLLPKNQTLRYDGKFFEGEDGFNEAESRLYIVDDLGYSLRRGDKSLSSLAEDSLDAQEIYPKRVGTVSKVVTVDTEKNFFDIVDNTIPEALNFEDCLIEGETMRIIFQSGMMSGKEFDVKYIHDSKDGKDARRFEIIPEEVDGETMPNDVFKPAVGDKYAVFGCYLPQAYISDNTTKTGAEWDMFREGVKYMFDNEDFKFSFSGKLDGIFAKRDWANIGGKIRLGGFIRFSDSRFQQEGVLVRITGIKDSINNPHSPELTLSNSTVTSGFSTTMKTLEAQEVTTEDLHREAIQFTKRRFRDSRETLDMLREAMLSNFTDNVSPVSIQTMSLLVGDESLQFRFINSLTDSTPVDSTVEWNSEQKRLTVGPSVIEHLTLGIKTLSSSHSSSEYKKWVLPAYSSAVLTEGNKRYFLYAKCSKDSTSGEFIISERGIKIDGVDGFYHLLVGVLNSEFEGERSYASLYGFTEVLPSRVTTDKVVSGDGNSFFDMLNNAFKLGDALSFNTEGDRVLRLKGTIVQNEGGAESPLPCYRGEYNTQYTYFNGDEVTYLFNGAKSTFRYIYQSPSSGVAPTDSRYWTVAAEGSKGEKGDKGDAGDKGDTGERGEDGPFTEMRFSKNGSNAVPPDIDKESLAPEGWSVSVPSVSSGEYLWFSVAKKNGTGTSLITSWSQPSRMTPIDGKDGKNGSSPALVYRENYDPSKTYYGNSFRVDAVRYNGRYYVARTDAGIFSGQTPTNRGFWNDFGASFESIATGLLLAEWANIAGFVFKSNKMWSQWGTVNGNPSQNPTEFGFVPNLEIDGVNGVIKTGENVYLKKEGLEITHGRAKTLVRNQSLTDIISSLTSGGVRGTFKLPAYATQGEALPLSEDETYQIILDCPFQFDVPQISDIRTSSWITIEAYYDADINIYENNTIVETIPLYHLIEDIVTVDSTETVWYNPGHKGVIRKVLSLSLEYGQSAEIEVHTGITKRGEGTFRQTGSLSMTISGDAEWFIRGLQWTLVGRDGIYIEKDGTHFEIINNGESLTIGVKGLPTTAPSQRGVMWVDKDGSLKIS